MWHVQDVNMNYMFIIKERVSSFFILVDFIIKMCYNIGAFRGGSYMLLEEFYKRLDNPIDRKDIIGDILNAYYEGKSFLGDHFYGEIVKNHYNKQEHTKDIVKEKRSQKTICCYHTKARDEYYKYCFNQWKNAMNHLANGEVSNYQFRKEAMIITDYLKDINPQSADEILKLMREIYDQMDINLYDFNLKKRGKG